MVGVHCVAEVGEQLIELLREVVRRALATIALQCERGRRIGPRRPSDAEIHPAGEQAGQHAERLGNLQRAVMRKHDAAAADPEPRRRAADRTEQHFRRHTRQRRRAVVLGHPIAVIPKAVRSAGEIDRVA